MFFSQRKHPRLKQYDYAQYGCYHLTFCTQNRKPILSHIVPASSAYGRARTVLHFAGQVTDRYIKNIPNVYTDVELVKYSIMPNHVHLLLLLGPQSSASIPTIIRSLKRMVNRELKESIWQDSYYDVIIRNETMFQCEWLYIDSNPDKWAEDDLFVAGPCVSI